MCVFALACDPPGPAHQPPAALASCTSGPRLTTIAGAVERLNALPPSEPACLLASLARPLSIVASTSITSAQPADSRESPRFFVLDDALVLSFVPSGDGQHLVEFGQWTDATHTLKGELQLPRVGELAADAPHTRVRMTSPATTCGLCHRDESMSDSVPNGYVSLAYRPVDRTLVPLSELLAAHEKCTRDEDASERCVLFHALFDFGTVKQGAFRSNVPLFGE